MNTETNFMSFEDLTKLIEEHKKETHPYKKYEFDSTSYTLLLISINNLIKENKKLNGAIQTYDILLKSNIEENKQLQEELECTIGIVEHNRIISEKNKENKQLKNNWNKLKEWASNFYKSEEVGWAGCGMRYTLEKMQELEQGSDSIWT